jgi:hypothetical protein
MVSLWGAVRAPAPPAHRHHTCTGRTGRRADGRAACGAVPCRAVRCRAMPCRAVPCRAMPKSVLCFERLLFSKKRFYSNPVCRPHAPPSRL